MRTSQPYHEQLSFDHGDDSFLAGVIQILKPTKIQIDINERGWPEADDKVPNLFTVRVEFTGIIPASHIEPLPREFHSIAYGRSYGQALYRVREELRLLLGQ